MLCQFSFQNFKSYKTETVFDFQAAAIPEFADSLIRREKCSSLLPVGVLYGSNGGGKTNLLQALSCVITAVAKPICDLEKNWQSIIMRHKVDVEPFLYDAECPKKPIEFQIYFRTGEYEYRYYLGILKNVITAEMLDRKKIGGKKPAHIFYREGQRSAWELF